MRSAPAGDELGADVAGAADGDRPGVLGEGVGARAAGGEGDGEDRRDDQESLHRAAIVGLHWRCSDLDLVTRKDAAEDPGRRQTSRGPASFAGTSRIRFRGSVAVATLSAHMRSPEAVFGCRAMVHPVGSHLEKRASGP